MLKPLSTAEVNFHLGEEIGAEGKNSQVYRARDVQLDAELAIKKVEKARLDDVDEFFQEASLLYLSSHTNVVPIHYACQDEDHIYLAMPFFENGSLKGRMAAGHLTVREVITYSTQFLSGLHNIHSKGLIHFDIKPDNILLSARGEAMLSDFGLAKQTAFGGRAGQDRIYGKMTPPEAFNAYEFTRHFDIYQAGLTIYRLAVGDSAFYEQFENFVENGVLNRDRFRHAVVNGQFPSCAQFPEHIPNRLITTIRTCLSRNPQERFHSASEIVNSFADIEGGFLDWRLSGQAGDREWTKKTGDRRLRLRVNADGTSEATRQIGDGQAKRVREYCQQALSRADIKRFLREY
ncbi:serine/threonine-protein kinase [Halomonas sp. JS92-SW72]|uniref:serine/threonine-protein kinase n=1 Tax=Halomonas sp. JS92-SW72 TaxID=2306583 RepID=UPI000E5A5CC5|nr:serine/threonine-protein kinase [Halomonas sp. JS92-SW72]AXY40863.1 serine/threonine protein kinase [Halomonas sp. JS92-SW72]